MADRLFRFGVVAAAAQAAAEGTGRARHAEDLGYATSLTPDTRGTLPPLLALSAAAAVTTSIGLGTFVLAAPNRRPEQLGYEVRGLSLLSGGRFELGLGAGRPAAQEDAARLGVAYGTPDQRIKQVEEMLRQTRKWADGPAPRVLIAASGARMMGFAARNADTVALGLPPGTPEDGLAEHVRLIRQAAVDFDALELSTGVLMVGDDAPPWLARQLGPDVPEDAISVLRGSPREMAARLLRRRDAHQVSYITVLSTAGPEHAR